MPHADRERELQISLATALRELDEARTDAANLRFVNDKARESLAAANARADTAEAELSTEKDVCGALRIATNDLAESLAAARRECEGLRKALERAADGLRYGEAADLSVTTATMRIEVWRGIRDAYYAARAALAAPALAPGEETTGFCDNPAHALFVNGQCVVCGGEK